jgi:phosphate starvation-inducible protein PhoH and related proteins
MNSLKIKKITVINDNAIKYSVNVQDNHNYISTGNLLSHNCVIVDEAQNVTNEQMEMIVTRVGLRSKMIICGDDGQVDLKNKSESGFKFLYNCSKKIKNLEGITLIQNHRDPIVDDLIDIYEEENERRNRKSQNK